METKPAFSMTEDTIMVIQGGVSHLVRKGQSNFAALRQALQGGRWGDVSKHLRPDSSVEAWAQGRFAFVGGDITFDGHSLPASLTSRIKEMASKGESPQPFFAFWERLQRNPSYRSVQTLWGFLEYEGIPITEDGCFLAYKSVREDYRDHHTGNFDNSPGTVNRMPRNQISDDPNKPCHEGFHVGSFQYASGFKSAPRIVICKIDPENVVSVPYDASAGKIRVCEYAVIGNHNGGKLSSTVHEEDDGLIDEVETDEPGDEAQPEPAPVKVPRKYQKYLKMDEDQLLKLSIEKLREYAYRGLKIVGATKVPGGKLGLIDRIQRTITGN